MTKHIFGAIAILLSVAAVGYLAKIDLEVGSIQKATDVIVKSEQMANLAKQQASSTLNASQSGGSQQVIGSATGAAAAATAAQDAKKEDEDRLKALKDKAGPSANFKVSDAYKSKCSSCHRIDGTKSVGPSLVGLTKDKAFASLKDFKSGAKKNYVMYGLLQGMSEAELETLSTEIGEFEARAKAAN